MALKKIFLPILALEAAFFAFSCASDPQIQKIQDSAQIAAQNKPSSQLDSTRIHHSLELKREAVAQQTRFSTIYYGIDSILSDEDAVSRLLSLARKHYEAALRLKKSGSADSSAIEFENAINVLNDLSYYPDIESDSNFVKLSTRIIKDYEKYISSVENLGPGTSVFALQEKLSQVLDSIKVPPAEFKKESIPKTTIPLVMNEYVEQNIEFFTTRGRWHMQNWIDRAGAYIPEMKKIFKKYGLPEELAYLSMPESGLNPTARSWANAVGLWQFIRSTGSLYGLHANWWYDDRRNPTKATEAAARHLRDLYDYFGDWYLTIAAYNCGSKSVDRAIRRSHGSRDFWEIRKYLPRETRNYVPQFIAVTLIALNPKEYGFSDSVTATPARCDTVRIPDSIDLRVLADATGVSLDTLMSLNPQLVHAVTPPDFDGNGFPLNVPEGTAETFLQSYEKIPESAKLSWTFHRTVRGETLYSIARRYGVSLASLKRSNDLSWRTRRVRPGTILVIPVKSSYYASERKRKNISPELAEQRFEHRKENARVHIVRRGETLEEIASLYGITVAQLKKNNNLHSSLIRTGMRLRVTSNPLLADRGRDRISRRTQSPTANSYVYHRVRKGESLNRIASIYGVSVENLREWNGLTNSHIRAGERLRIMSPAVSSAKGDNQLADDSDSKMIYKVKSGDSLWKISRRFGVPISSLKKWNGKLNEIHPGQRLIIYR
ncbi:MAG: LysM peptidoglycan-binding domain-containing protein [Candidatus Kryptoniota bacterium]